MSSAQTAHRQSLAGVRRALGFTLVGRDRDAGALCRRQDLTIPAETPLRARLYIPEGADPASPGLVFFHGGGFVFCDIESHDAFCARLAAAGRFRLLSVDYRLAPEARFPAQLEDAIAALTWARANAADLGVNPDRLGAGGDSAGGYLAIAASARVNADRPGSVSALALIYPLLQMDDEVWASSLFRHSRLLGPPRCSLHPRPAGRRRSRPLTSGKHRWRPAFGHRPRRPSRSGRPGRHPPRRRPQGRRRPGRAPGLARPPPRLRQPHPPVAGRTTGGGRNRPADGRTSAEEVTP